MRNKLTVWCMLAVLLLTLPAIGAAQDAEETFGCEANPTGNPIGGGEGYTDILTTGDFIVKTTAEFLAALKEAKPGQVIYVPDGTEIDLTASSTLMIPTGVTLAGSRGRDGSLGARIFTTRKSGRMFSVGGDDVRLTGLRFEGPYGGSDRVAHSAYFLGTSSYGTEIDNCEIYNFNVAAIGVGSGAINCQIHHNFIHHSQRSGLGYGVSTGSSDLHVIANKFDYCRHHIASGGTPGSGYEAAWNLILPHANGHHFDMHGGRDRGDSTNIAGDWMHVHHNTFLSPHRHVIIRGVPSDHAEVHHNWFVNPVAKSVISGGNTKVYRNVYGPEKILEE